MRLPVHPWPSGVRALAYPDYRLLWAGALVSNIGSWMQITAQAWVIYEISGHDSAWLGLDTFASGVPVLLTPLAGVLADHVNRRRLMAVLTLLQMVVAGYLAVALWAGFLSAWQIIICSAISGTLGTFLIPAFFALMPDLVSRKDLSNGVALNALQFNVSRVLGPVLAGLVLHHFGAASSFGFNALSFVGVLVALALIHPHAGHRPKSDTTALESFFQGVSYMRSRRDLLLMVTIVLTAGMFGSPLMNLLPALCREGMGRTDEASFATLLSCIGVGAVIGAALLAARSHRPPKPWIALYMMIGTGLCEIVIGWFSNYAVTVVVITIAGTCLVNTMARTMTAVTASIPSSLRGRVSSTVFIGIGLGFPLGALVSGFMAKHVSVTATYMTFGCLIIAAAMLLALVKKSLGIRYSPQPDEHAAPAGAGAMLP